MVCKEVKWVCPEMKCMWDLYWFSTTWLDPMIICFEGSSLDLKCCQPQRWDQSEGEGVITLKRNKKKQWYLRSLENNIYFLTCSRLLSGREDPNSEGNSVQIALLILEKEMATHSSVLAWRIPGTEEPGRRPSMGSRRVGHDWRDLAAAAALLILCTQPEDNLVICSSTFRLYRPDCSFKGLFRKDLRLSLCYFVL